MSLSDRGRETPLSDLLERELGPDFVPDLFEFDGKTVRLDYAGIPDDDESLGEMIAESGGSLSMPSMYSLTEVGTGVSLREFLVFGEGGFSPYEMALHLAVNREGATPIDPAPSMNESLVCEHGLSAALCSGPNHYPMEDSW